MNQEGREIRTLLPTLESNLSAVVPNHDAISRKDEKTKTTYRENFDNRHGAWALPELLPRDSVRVKLDKQKGWKTPGRVVAKSSTPRSHAIQTPSRVVRRNRRRLRLVPDSDTFAKPVKQELDLEPELQTAGTDLKSPRAEIESLPQVEFQEPWRVTSTIQSSTISPSILFNSTSSQVLKRSCYYEIRVIQRLCIVLCSLVTRTLKCMKPVSFAIFFLSFLCQVFKGLKGGRCHESLRNITWQ